MEGTMTGSEKKRKSIRYRDMTIRERVLPSGKLRYQLERWSLGRMVRTMHESMAVAKGKADDIANEIRKYGDLASILSTAQRLDAANALDVLAGRVTLTEAADYWARRHAATGAGETTVAALLDLYMADARARRLRSATLHDMETRLGRLVADLGESPAAAIATEDLDGWLDGLEVSPANRKNFRTVIHGLFAWAAKTNRIPENPAAKMLQVQVERGMPSIVTPSDVRKIMDAAVRVAPEAVPYLALAFFAGVRSNEITLLRWSDIDLVSGTVTVRPEVAKKRRSRIIRLADNAAAWLRGYAGKGDVAPESLRAVLARVQRASVSWPHNAARHSFASYHLALHSDISRTCLDLGHTQPAVLFEHYRNLATREQAEAYFGVLPAAGQVVRFVAAG
jgi:integrase